MAAFKLNLKPTPRELRQFGFIALAAFGLLGALLYWQVLPLARHLGGAAGTVAWVLWVVGLASAALSLVAPRANWPLYAGLMVIAYPIGWVLSHVILGLVFFGLITPLGLIFRLMGRDALHLRSNPRTGSYWVPARRTESLESYFRQY
jgi:hypothetical protein